MLTQGRFRVQAVVGKPIALLIAPSINVFGGFGFCHKLCSMIHSVENFRKRAVKISNQLAESMNEQEKGETPHGHLTPTR